MIRKLSRNLWWKLGALAVSFLLWLVFNGSNELTESVSVPVQYRNLPEGLEIGSELVEHVHLVLRGPSLLLSREANTPAPVILDLSEPQTSGEKTFTLSPQNVRLPSGVTLEKAIPGQIRLRLEPRLRKDVPIRVRFDHVPAGQQAYAAETWPLRLTISGPESHVRAIDAVDTDVVDFRTQRPGNVAETVAYLADARVGFDSKPTVKVRVELRPVPKD